MCVCVCACAGGGGGGYVCVVLNLIKRETSSGSLFFELHLAFLSLPLSLFSFFFLRFLRCIVCVVCACVSL